MTNKVGFFGSFIAKDGSDFVLQKTGTDKKILERNNDIQLLNLVINFSELDKSATDIKKLETLQSLSGILSSLGKTPILKHIRRPLLKLFAESGFTPISRDKTEKMRQKLNGALESGFLKTAPVILDEIKLYNCKNSQDKIEKKLIVSVPTKNRPDRLRSVLETLLANMHRHKKNNPVVVMDDSDKDEAMQANISLLREISNDFPEIQIRYGTREDRKRFSHTLADIAGVDRTIVNFLLLGKADEGVPSGGSNRNSIVLDNAGHNILQIDDDMLINTLLSKNTDERRLRFDSNYPRKTLVQENVKGRTNLLESDIDFIGSYEKYLGLHPAQTFKEYANTRIDVSNCSNLSTNMLVQEKSRIKLITSGVTGETGMTYMPLLGSAISEETLAEITKNRDTLTNFVNNPYITQYSDCLCLQHGYVHQSMSIGFSNGDVPPFFSPVQREDDTFFNLLFSHLDKHAYSLHLPQIITHNRIDRAITIDQKKYNGRFMQVFNVLMACLYRELLYTNNPSAITPFENGLKIIGDNLIKMASLNDAEFHKKITENIDKDVMLSKLYYLDILAKAKHRPKIFKEKIIDEILLNSADFINEEYGFWDVPGRQFKDRLTKSKDWLGLLGICMTKWSAVWHTAKTLNKSGVRISRGLKEYGQVAKW